MKKILLYISVSLALISCGRPSKQTVEKNPFITDVMLKTTPIKNQGHSQLCWAYAMLATIETNHLMTGDSVNLSADYIARMMLTDASTRYYLSKGKNTISMRGMGCLLIDLMQNYGIVPFDSYNAKEPANYNVICRKIMQASKSANNLSTLNQKVNDVLDEEVGYMPSKYVHMLGAEYTPLEFSHSVCRDDEYINVTSFKHHVMGESFILETPDNIMNDKFLNVPIETLMSMITKSIVKGKAVCWEGDITESGFSFNNGIAETNHRTVTQDLRQQEFESRQTTDDHAMELVGLAHDKNGKKYFIAKNSWGTGNRFKGYMYLSYNYVKLKTIAIFLSQD